MRRYPRPARERRRPAELVLAGHRRTWRFSLRANGIDARLDLSAGEERQDWTGWMSQQILHADQVLVVASPEYKLRAEGDAAPARGRGVQWEVRLIQEWFYAISAS